MKRTLVLLAVLGCALTSTVRAAYDIDGSLSDWGVTPFSDWVPEGTADYVQTDNVNLYNAAYYVEFYDVEAAYFDNDAQNFYVALVTSYPARTGDFGFDLNGDMSISSHGVVTGLEYAMPVGTGAVSQVLSNPVWTPTEAKEWPGEGWQGSPYKVADGTVIGSATTVVQYYPGMESGTYILETAIPRSLFPDNGGGADDLVVIHWTMFCGNDSINLVGTLNDEPPPPVPAPGAVVLGVLGLGLVAGLRRRGTLG